MGPYGPSVEERKRLQLEYLKTKYGDKPIEELVNIASEESYRIRKELEREKQHRKTA